MLFTIMPRKKAHTNWLTPWLMEPGGPILHLQGLVELVQFLILTPIPLRPILVLSSHLCLGLPRSLFPLGLSDNILKTLLHSSILVTCTANWINIWTIARKTLWNDDISPSVRKYYLMSSTVTRNGEFWYRRDWWNAHFAEGCRTFFCTAMTSLRLAVM